MCWLHDLPAWGRVVARLLKPGGILHLLDDHPVTWLFDFNAQTLVAQAIDYFEHAERNQGWPDTYIGNRDRNPSDMPTKHEKIHPISEVFSALTNAGLQVTHLGEHREPYWCVFPNLDDVTKRKLPLTFSMMATKS